MIMIVFLTRSHMGYVIWVEQNKLTPHESAELLCASVPGHFSFLKHLTGGCFRWNLGDGTLGMTLGAQHAGRQYILRLRCVQHAPTGIVDYILLWQLLPRPWLCLTGTVAASLELTNGFPSTWVRFGWMLRGVEQVEGPQV